MTPPFSLSPPSKRDHLDNSTSESYSIRWVSRWVAAFQKGQTMWFLLNLAVLALLLVLTWYLIKVPAFISSNVKHEDIAKWVTIFLVEVAVIIVVGAIFQLGVAAFFYFFIGGGIMGKKLFGWFSDAKSPAA